MGQEHGAERTAARDKLEQLNERRPHRYPRAWVFATWEELWWRWTEELKIELRRMLREMQTENPTKEELRFYALAQGPRGATNLSMPTTFQLDDPQAYYRSVVEPRIERAYDRVMWGNAWKGMETPRKAGGHVLAEEPVAAPPDACPEERDERAGAAPTKAKAKGRARASSRGRPATQATPQYPAGTKTRPLRIQEVAQAYPSGDGR